MAKKRRKLRIPNFKKVIENINNIIINTAKEELEKFTVQLWEDLKHGIILQKFESFKTYPLTPAYQARKKRQNLDDRVMIATGHYLNSIEVIKHTDIRYEVNVPKDAYAHDAEGVNTHIKLRLLGRIHEYGSASAGIPPRKHWGTVIQKGKKVAKKVAKKIGSNSVRLIKRTFKS